MSRAEKQKAGTSTGSTPKDKKLKVEDEEKEVEEEAMEGGDEDMSAKEMLKKMMTMMTAMKKDMKATRKEVEEAKDIAQQAKYAANVAEQAVEAVREEVSTIKEDLPNIVKDLVKGEVGGHGSKWGPSAPGAPSRARTGADDKKAERSSRTVTFGTFPENTKADDIIEFMNGILKDVKKHAA